MVQNINKIWLIYCLFLVSIANNLLGHGVADETLVSILASNIKPAILTPTWMQIDQLQNCIHEQNTLVKTWSERQLEFRNKSVRATSTGDINCYMELWLLANPYQTLRCAPDQLFYVLPQPNINYDLIHQPAQGPTYVQYHDLNQAIKAGYWAQACTLQPGQILLRENDDQAGHGIQVTQVDFKAQALKAYNLDVTDDHTYLITRFNIVTHNSELLAVFAQHTVQHSFHIAAATGTLATIGNWLSAAGITTGSTGLFTLGITVPLSAPVLIAASTVGAGLVAWHVFNFWGRKHVGYSQSFDLSSLQNTRAQLNQMPTPCGSYQAKPTEAELATCGAPNLTTQTLLGGKLIGANQPPVTSCPTSQVLSGKSRVAVSEVSCLANLPTLVAVQNLDYQNNDTNDKANGCLKNDFVIDSDNLDSTMQESKTDEKIHQEIVQFIDEFLKTATFDVKKEAKIYVKDGGVIKLAEDFASFPLIKIENKETIKGKIKVGYLLNGWKVIERHSQDKRPTLEIQKSGTNYKIRYQ